MSKAPPFPPDSAPAEEWRASANIAADMGEADAMAFVRAMGDGPATPAAIALGMVEAFRARGVPGIWIAAATGHACGAGLLPEPVYLAVMEALEAETRTGN